MAEHLELPHGRALRIGRWSESGRIYLITSVTDRRRPIFSDLYAGRALVNAFQVEQQRSRARTMAFVVMPDHFHWLMQLGEKELLPRVVRCVKSYSARRINRLLGRTGTRLWQPGFHDHALRKEEDLVGVARYVVANPLRAGVVGKLRDFPLWDAIWL